MILKDRIAGEMPNPGLPLFQGGPPTNGPKQIGKWGEITITLLIKVITPLITGRGSPLLEDLGNQPPKW